MEYQKLTVHHYSDDPKEERRITIAPSLVTVIAAGIEDVMVKGLQLRAVTVLFMDGGSIDLVVNHSDLTMLEEAVGSYSMSHV